ncbi:hypothetical protein NQ318_013218 [Aromia moschata]|uniref:Uncharacterized protein n=1 Tax=Aromia moschata TaxID=1265417 RepID=A0AAV8YAD4_9CUCU|nr:hypothetical protein NQ318_013218 [Aromia moschata]
MDPKMFPPLTSYCLSKRREKTEDDPLPGQPSTSKTDEKIEKAGKLIREDRRLSIRGLAEITGIDKECVRQILHESLNMRKVCAKMASKLLTPKQKDLRINFCADILNNIDTDPGLLDTVTLKGSRFEYVEAVTAKATEVLNQLTEADFQHCFQQWKSLTAAASLSKARPPEPIKPRFFRETAAASLSQRPYASSPQKPT